MVFYQNNIIKTTGILRSLSGSTRVQPTAPIFKEIK